LSSTAAALQVIDFVRALALAWKNVAAYPPGHPALLASLEQVNRCLRELRGPAGEVTLGIANDGLIYGEAKIDATAAQKFAQALYTRGIAIVRLSVDTTGDDIAAFLRLLATSSKTLPEDLTAAGVVNINLQAVRYDSVQVTDDLAQSEQQSVWEEILRALLENRQFSASDRQAPSANTLDELSRLIAEYAVQVEEETTFDPKATFGIRMAAVDGSEHPLHRFLELTVGERIAESTGIKKQHALEQAVQLIKTLPDQLRRTILRAVTRALAADESAASLLRQFSAALPGDEVLDALRTLSAMGPLSGHAMELMQSLAPIESTGRTEAPSPNVVADLVRLFGDDDVNRFNPAEYRSSLTSFSVRIPEIPPQAVTSLEKLGLQSETVAETMPQFTRVLLDMLSGAAEAREVTPVIRRIESVFRSQIESRHYVEALNLIAELREIHGHKNEIEQLIGSFAAGDAVQRLVESVQEAPAEFAQLVRRLTDALGTSAHRSLLEALASENSRSRRRRLFDFIASIGPAIVPEALPFLKDERWYVLRNMIVLLRTVQDKTSLPQIRELAQHPDLRVKMEAIKSLFAIDPNVPRSLLDNLLEDPDPKVSEAAITMVGAYGIKEGIDPLLRMLEGNDMMGAKRMIRIKVMKALGDIGEPRALAQLDRFMKPSILPWPSKDERYAAWQTLHRYPADAREPFVERGLKSKDPQIRAICVKLQKSN
jgi:HEAT repeat protein